MTGAVVKTKSVVQYTDADHKVMTMFMTGPDGKEAQSMKDQLHAAEVARLGNGTSPKPVGARDQSGSAGRDPSQGVSRGSHLRTLVRYSVYDAPKRRWSAGSS